MSDETARNLQEAIAAEAERRTEAENQKRQCLAAVARGIPDRADALAKRTAQKQPEVAKRLGSDGIKGLRAELAEVASQIASRLEGAAEQIDWPRQVSEYSPIDTRHIHDALFKVLYGEPVDSLAQVLKRHGFSIQDENERSQHLIMPQSLYDQGQFAEVAEALTAMYAAERAVAAAKAADDTDTVDSLWQDN